MKKIASLLLAVTFLVSLAGCSSASKPEPTVTKFCDALKTLDMETAASCFVSEDTAMEDPYTDGDTEEQDIFTEQAINYLKNCASEMTYTIGESTIEGDTAVVPVTFTYTDASPVVSAAMVEYFSQALVLAFSGADDATLEALFGTIFMEKAESVSTGTATSTVEFECIKTDNEWKIQPLNDDAQHEIDNIITCNMEKAFDSLEGDFSDDSSSSFDADEDYVWSDVPAGQVLELATIKISISGWEETDQLTADYCDPDIAQEGTKYIVITAAVENITKSTLEFNNDLSLYDSQGREYQPYSDALWYFDETFTYTDLAPNITTTGTFVYHVPADAEDYYLVAVKSGTDEAYRLYVQ